jgi:hypothetical protein
MGLKLDIADLASREIRAKIGKRTIKALQTQSAGNTGTRGALGLAQWVWNGAGQLGGFLVGIIKGLLSLDFKKIWLVITTAIGFIWNFNWNATDKDLQNQLQAKINALAVRSAGIAGNAFGWAACGALPGAAIFVFNEALGAKILKDVATEGLEELLDGIKAIAYDAFVAGIYALAIWAFTNVRKLIKSRSRLIGRIFGSKIETMAKSWGETGSKPWSFASSFESQTEKISNETLREAVEEFFEEAVESCVEAGYVVANSIDSYIASKKLGEEIVPTLGKERTIELTPNRNFPDNKIIISGKEDILKQTVVQTLVLEKHTIGNRDIGNIYGTSDGFPVRSIKPEVVLKFYQAKKDRITGKDANGKNVADPNPISMQISFRLMNKSEDDFKDEVYAKQLAAKIYAKFGNPAYKINKGKELYTYADYAKGYQLTLWVVSQAEARRVVEQILDIQGHSVDNDLLRVGSKPVNGRQTRDKKIVFGNAETITAVGNKEGIVTFTHAILNIGNGTQPINLVDLTGRRKKVVHKNT